MPVTVTVVGLSVKIKSGSVYVPAGSVALSPLNEIVISALTVMDGVTGRRTDSSAILAELVTARETTVSMWHSR